MVRFLLSLAMLTVISVSVQAEGFQYEEGTHFVKLEIPVKTRDPNVVEVTEYFSYGCSHCYRFEALIQPWKASLPEDVEFNRTPAIWQVTGYELYARTYYTAQALGVLDQIHAPLFQAIHSERRRILDLKTMAKFVAEHGVEPEVFVKTFNDSFGVRAMYQQAIARQRVYRSGGTPAIIVNGKFRVEASMVDNSNANMLKVASYLIDSERRLVQANRISE